MYEIWGLCTTVWGACIFHKYKFASTFPRINNLSNCKDGINAEKNRAHLDDGRWRFEHWHIAGFTFERVRISGRKIKHTESHIEYYTCILMEIETQWINEFAGTRYFDTLTYLIFFCSLLSSHKVVSVQNQPKRTGRILACNSNATRSHQMYSFKRKRQQMQNSSILLAFHSIF